MKNEYISLLNFLIGINKSFDQSSHDCLAQDIKIIKVNGTNFSSVVSCSLIFSCCSIDVSRILLFSVTLFCSLKKSKTKQAFVYTFGAIDLFIVCNFWDFQSIKYINIFKSNNSLSLSWCTHLYKWRINTFAKSRNYSSEFITSQNFQGPLN